MISQQVKYAIKGASWIIIGFVIICIIVMVFPRSCHAQTRLTWDQYNRQAKIELLTVNAGLMIYANQKQVLLPVKTQRITNLIVYPLCIGFTFYKAIQWRERKQRPTDIKYTNQGRRY